MITNLPDPFGRGRSDDCTQCGAFMPYGEKWAHPVKFKGQTVCKACHFGTRVEAHQATYIFEVEADIDDEKSPGDILRERIKGKRGPPQLVHSGTKVWYPPKGHTKKKRTGKCYGDYCDDDAEYSEDGVKIRSLTPLGVYCKWHKPNQSKGGIKGRLSKITISGTGKILGDLDTKAHNNIATLKASPLTAESFSVATPNGSRPFNAEVDGPWGVMGRALNSGKKGDTVDVTLSPATQIFIEPMQVTSTDPEELIKDIIEETARHNMAARGRCACGAMAKVDESGQSCTVSAAIHCNRCWDNKLPVMCSCGTVIAVPDETKKLNGNLCCTTCYRKASPFLRVGTRFRHG